MKSNSKAFYFSVDRISAILKRNLDASFHNTGTPLYTDTSKCVLIIVLNLRSAKITKILTLESNTLNSSQLGACPSFYKS